MLIVDLDNTVGLKANNSLELQLFEDWSILMFEVDKLS